MTPTTLAAILACATCMADPNDGATHAAGISIFFLLLVILCVGIGCARFFVFLARCERRAVRPSETNPEP